MGKKGKSRGKRPPARPPPPAATTVAPAPPPAASSAPLTPGHVHRAPLLLGTKKAWAVMFALSAAAAAVVQLQDSALFAPLFSPSPRVSHEFGLQEPPLLVWIQHDGRPHIGGVKSIIPLHLTYAHTRPLVVESISVDFGAYDLGEVATDDTGQPSEYRHGTLRGPCDGLKLAATREEIEKAISERASEPRSFPFPLDTRDLYIAIYCDFPLRSGDSEVALPVNPSKSRKAHKRLVPLLFGFKDLDGIKNRTAMFTIRTNLRTFTIKVPMIFIFEGGSIPIQLGNCDEERDEEAPGADASACPRRAAAPR